MKPLYLFVGPSASGKTTVSEIIEHTFGFKSIASYTTRPPRYEGETGHTFVDDATFDTFVDDLVSFTEYNGHRYGTTKEQLDNVEIFVVDIPGVRSLLQKYKRNRKIVILYFDSTVSTRIDRMIDRGSSDAEIVGRLHTDETHSWWLSLEEIEWNAQHLGLDVELEMIDADRDIESVVAQVADSIVMTGGDGD